jgi:hypothetical protein
VQKVVQILGVKIFFFFYDRKFHHFTSVSSYF